MELRIPLERAKSGGDERLRVPIGIEEGTALRIPGRGLPSPVAGGEPGDLYVLVYSQPDPRFARRGADLLSEQRLELPDAVLGTTLAVPTLEGSAKLRVPAGTQPDEMLRLRGKGLPPFGGGPRGDLYVRMRLHVPEQLSREERKLYERARELAARRRG
jgi:molecular chaperone DnaJ